MVYYVSAAASVMMKGPTGILIPLGIEQFLPIETALIMYNFISLGFIFFIAAMSGSRSESRFCVVVPIITGMFMYIGWLNAPNPAKAWAITIIAGLLGVAIYMNEMNHEKYGIGGPGSKLMNLVFFLIIFQAAFGLISNYNLIEMENTQPIPDVCNVGYNCDEYRNIDLSNSVTQYNESTGILSSVFNALTQLPTVVLQIIIFMINILAFVTFFPFMVGATLNGIFPGISTNVYYLAFAGVMNLAIWAIYVKGIGDYIRGTGDSSL